MDTTTTPVQLTCKPGDEVYSADDHKIGTVEAFDQRVLTVKHGTLIKGEYFIPTSAVNNCERDRVYLNVPKDAIGHQGWDVPPPLATDAGNPPIMSS
jgi:hypothetical protein